MPRFVNVLFIFFMLATRSYLLCEEKNDDFKLIDYIVENREALSTIFSLEVQYSSFSEKELFEYRKKIEKMIAKTKDPSLKANMMIIHINVCNKLNIINLNQSIELLKKLKNDHGNEICIFSNARLNGLFRINQAIYAFIFTTLQYAREEGWNKRKTFVRVQKESGYYKNAMEYYKYSLKNPILISEAIPFYIYTLNKNYPEPNEFSFLKELLDQSKIRFEASLSERKQEIMSKYSSNPIILKNYNHIFLWFIKYYFSYLKKYDYNKYLDELEKFCLDYSEDGFLFPMNHLYYETLCAEKDVNRIKNNTSMLQASLKAEQRYIILLSKIIDSRFTSDKKMLFEPFEKYCKSICALGIDIKTFLLERESENQYLEQTSTNYFAGELQRHKNEELERKLKSMPKAKAQEYCLDKALELAETPKGHEEELALYLRGIPVPEETQVSKLLHRICDNSQDVELLDAVARIQGKWLSREAEQREIMLADLTALLESDNGRLRAMAVQALGRSSSLDALPPLLEMLEKDGYNRDEVLSAILKLLGEKANVKALSEERIESIRNAARQYWKALETLHAVTNLDNQTIE